MSKKTILIILAIIVVTFLSKSINQKHSDKVARIEESNKVVVTDKTFIFAEDQSLNVNAYFKLGLTRDEMYNKLKELNIKIIFDEKIANGSIWCEKSHFTFNKDNKLSRIFVSDTSEFITAKGLKMHDDMEKAKEIYGAPYSQYIERDGMVYEYKFKNNYFLIQISDTTKDIIGMVVSIDE